MELKKIIESLKPYFLFLIILGIVGGIIGAKSASFFPQGYRQSQLFFVTEPSAIDSQDSVGAYFKQEKERNFTDTAAAIIQDPNFSNEVFAAQVSLSVRKLAPQVVRITAQSPHKESLYGTFQKISTAFNTKINQLSISQANQITPIFEPENLSYFALNKFVLAASGVILGLISGIMVSALKIYFKV